MGAVTGSEDSQHRLNGRLRVVGIDRPGVDAIYRRLVAEALAAWGLDRDEAFANAVARRFSEGATRLCARSIGGWIEARLEALGWTQRQLADRIGVDRSAVARWTSGGTISLGHLVRVLLELAGNFVELPVPLRQELALEGYLAALTHVQNTVEPRERHERLDREGFWCLYHLLSEPHWERAIRDRDRDQIRREVLRIQQRMTESLGHPPRRIVAVEDVRRTVERWTVAWVVGLQALPGGWAIRTETHNGHRP